MVQQWRSKSKYFVVTLFKAMGRLLNNVDTFSQSRKMLIPMRSNHNKLFMERSETFGRRHSVGMFLLSLATLLLELALTRVLSVALWYHFGFLIVSTALLGFGIDAMLARWRRCSQACTADRPHPRPNALNSPATSHADSAVRVDLVQADKLGKLWL